MDETFDKIIAFSEDNLNKKYYIFGFYSNDDKEKINKNNDINDIISKTRDKSIINIAFKMKGINLIQQLL